MADAAKRIRIGLVVAAVLLLAVVGGFVGYAHWRAQQYLRGLPGRLGMHITQESDGVTYSQSYEGRTIFTVHAAKNIQRADGTYTLKDVRMVLYGKDGKREDKIRGEEFTYDQKNGVLAAVGEAFIDLAAPDGDVAKTVHVTTRGLIYRQKEKTAETAEEVEFATGGFAGKAVGARYDGDTGGVRLEHAVRVSGLKDDKPVLLTADTAELDKAGNVVRLEGARYAAGMDSVAADKAVVRLTTGGVAQRVEAEGHVVLGGDGRGVVRAPRMEVNLNAKGGARDGYLSGGVTYANDTAARQERGASREARVAFDEAGKPVHSTMLGAVALDVTGSGSERHLRSETLELALGGGGKAKTFLQGAVAGGGADLKLVDAKGSTAVRGARLTGRFDAKGVAQGLDGVGGTRLERVTAKGKDVSEGAVLRLDFVPGDGGKLELARALQTGGVTSVQEVPGKDAEKSKAAGVEFVAATDTLTLTGGVQVSDAGRLLLADKVVAERGTGDAVAEGSVRVSYVQAKGEPVHVMAAKAVGNKASGATEFTAAAGGTVRLWQGGAAVEAPVIDFDNGTKQAVARGGVRAVLAGGVRAYGEQMIYLDSARTVEMTGPVKVEDAGGTVTAKSGIVYLGAGGVGGSVDRVVGVGDVVVTQPGRRATGERLVYTAGDEMSVLSGGAKVVDATEGTVTGGTIRFRRGDKVVVATGENGGRVRTETRVIEKQ